MHTLVGRYGAFHKRLPDMICARNAQGMQNHAFERGKRVFVEISAVPLLPDDKFVGALLPHIVFVHIALGGDYSA